MAAVNILYHIDVQKPYTFRPEDWLDKEEMEEYLKSLNLLEETAIEN